MAKPKRFKEKFISGNALGGLKLSITLDDRLALRYDKRLVRKALKQGGAEVRKEARKLLSRKAISNPGEFPGVESGALRRAIGVVSVGSGGGWVKIGPKSIKGSVFYPAFLYYGSPKTGLKKRGNYMETALANRRNAVRERIKESFKKSLSPA